MLIYMRESSLNTTYGGDTDIGNRIQICEQEWAHGKKHTHSSVLTRGNHLHQRGLDGSSEKHLLFKLRTFSTCQPN